MFLNGAVMWRLDVHIRVNFISAINAKLGIPVPHNILPFINNIYSSQLIKLLPYRKTYIYASYEETKDWWIKAKL
jgi:hypothetical protein